MKKIFWLGLHKTGSTSLQLFLQRNQQRLARHGILFPPATPQGFAQYRAETEDQAAPDSTPPLNTFMGHNALAYRMISEAIDGFSFPEVHLPMPSAEDILRDIQALIQTTGAKTLVFCSEDLARASLMVPQVPARFAQAFGAQDATLVAIIRRPDEAIAAWQAQKVNFGKPFAALRVSPPETWLGSVHMDYEATLRPWLRAFPGARITFVPYDALLAMGGSVAGFSELAGLSLPTGLAGVANANISLPHALIEIARAGFCALPRADAVALRTYLQNSGKRLDLPANTEIDLFTPKLRDTLCRAFSSSHDWLCQITGQVPFFDSLDDMRRSRPRSDIEAAREILPDVIADAGAQQAPPPVREFLDDLRRTL